MRLLDDAVRIEDEEGLLHRLVQDAVGLPRVEAAGCVLLPLDGHPAQSSASDDRTCRLERLQSQLLEGPGACTAHTGKLLVDLPMARPISRTRWPRFAPAVLRAGFTAVTAVPIRHDGVCGVLSLYHQRGALSPDQVERGRLLASAAAIGLAHHRALYEARVRERRLQAALDSRVLVEQAKGMLAERLDCTVGDAFELLRRHARAHRMRLRDLAGQIVSGPPAEGPFQRSPR
ncbi:GAF and ANTAR domain-containing protein [Streptomyces sp. NBC_01451]|uniref:GAF and ANTAR domain-containing protein n=1 Tax=Streptomyces sp. NBC_01451 TaxID=2903872 RepID=UPI002E312061|nr:GAF and ANTAR domain-containing protein [Streptomyces sp. NBC_01451]